MPDIQPFGDSAVLVSYDVDGFCTRTVKTLHALAQHLRETHNWEDIVPAYDSLLVRFNPAHEPQADVMAKVKTSITQMSPKNQSGRLVEFPVCYGGDFGPDMAQIQKSSGLSEPEIVAPAEIAPPKTVVSKPAPEANKKNKIILKTSKGHCKSVLYQKLRRHLSPYMYTAYERAKL